MHLRKRTAVVTAVAALLLLHVGFFLRRHNKKVKPVDHTAQRRYQHKIAMLQDGTRDGSCTATAVGPHALLTAEHCIKAGAHSYDNGLQIDLSVREYKVIAVSNDRRDHVILLIDGPAFKSYLSLKGNVRTVRPYEHVFIYGSGQGVYPPRFLEGYQIPFDPYSEVDQADGIQEFSVQDQAGDSGSAIYGDDGKVVALVTYGHKGPDIDYPTTVGFGLDFPDSVYEGVATYQGLELILGDSDVNKPSTPTIAGAAIR